MDPRTYLHSRFAADRDALLLRAEQLRDAANRSGAGKPVGPDAATSRDMADACSAVVAMVLSVPESASTAEQVVALSGLIPKLEQLGAQPMLSPPVRSVYIGAATRIREIGAAEVKAQSMSNNGTGDNADDHGDDAEGDDE